jgi:hypothetical protein
MDESLSRLEDEAGDVFGAWAGDLGGEAFLHDVSAFEDQQLVGDRHRVHRVVGDQDGDARVVDQVVPQLWRSRRSVHSRH